MDESTTTGPQRRAPARKAAPATKGAQSKAKKSKATKRPAGPLEDGAEATGSGAALVIVESPTKARSIGRYLGRGYDVRATVGHLRDLPTRELGVDVDRGFAPTYVTIKGKTKTLGEIKRAAKKAKAIYLATDPDREGEAIAWHVSDQLETRAPTHRVLFHEITADAVKEAMAHPGAIDDKKVDAQQARRILDRLVGYKASPILWKTIKTGLSAGRVQTVALRLIVEREDEIRKFVPQEYWTIAARLRHEGQEFEAGLHKLDGHKPQLPSAAEAQAVVDAVAGAPFVVTGVERKKRHKRPAAPFTTSTLQQEAAKKLGFTARRTMRAAQALYEGVEMGPEGPVGLITYMRTDSVRVSDQAIGQAREFIRATWGGPYLPEKPNAYSSKGARTQEAHEAVRPTDVRRRPESVQSYLEPDQFRLYQLIWQRFVASQMMPAVYDLTIVDFEITPGAHRYLFRATGSVVVFDGYHAVYLEGRETEEGKSVDDLPPIPPLEVNDQVEVLGIDPSQHFTQPPPRFSEAALVKALEQQGIGRPSTYASIVSTLVQREYVKLESRRFEPTELGETVCRMMVKNFPEIFNVEFTSEMEDELDRVEEGELGWQQVLTNFYGPFTRALESVDLDRLVMEAHGLADLSLEACPECGAKLTVKSGRFGPFIACTRYPECRYTKPLKKKAAPDRPTDEKCHLCGSAMVIKTGRFGEFLACTQYPKCKGTRSIPMGVKCPKCAEGELTERRTKRGKSFFGCLRYPECDFSTWTRPVPETCPVCGWVGMEKKSSKAHGDSLTCMKCGHKVVSEAEETADT